MPKGGIKNKNKIKFQGQKGLSGFWYISLAFLILGFLLAPQIGQAANPAYQAEKLAQSFNIINLAPGKAITFEVQFKNIGTATWYNYTKNYISLYADGAGKMFRHVYWFKAEQPAKLLENKVVPGQVGHLRFALQSPEVLGSYTARFKLASEDLTWINGGILEIPVNVTNNPSVSAISSVSQSSNSFSNTQDFQASKLSQSHLSVTLGAGEKIIFRVGFKNLGTKAWETTGENVVKFCLASGGTANAFLAASDSGANCVSAVTSPILSGQVGYFEVPFYGNIQGNYEANFNLMTGGQIISGSEVNIPIKVLTSVQTISRLDEPVASEPVSGAESTIRVGLYNTTEAVALRANYDFEVRDSENKLIFSVPTGATLYASFDFRTRQYAVNLNGELKNSLSYLRFVALDPNTIFEIVNYENRPNWNPSLNDNKFRGDLELRYSEERNKLYVINELPMEMYLKGLAESSNNNPIEYHKALAVAARTYAQYNINIGGKHPAGNFHLNASAYDQVYRGYNSEIRLPNFVRAVEETRGVVVTYNNEVVVTPYFAQSDGRTRSWEEVWFGGSKAWLVSKPDPYCSGMNLFGHGVGLSARGARGMALNGKNFEEILKYYYTGVEVKKIY